MSLRPGPRGPTSGLVTSVVVVLVVVLGASACTHPGKTQRRSRRLGGEVLADGATKDGSVVDPALPKDGQPVEPPRPPPKLVTSETTIERMAAIGGKDVAVKLGARVVRPDGEGGPVVVIVPGGSDISKEGTRKGDGVTVYDAPVDVGTAWSRALGLRGATVLSYDKRTCGPNDVASCNKNPQDDVDEAGPVALAADVDAACAVARAQPGFDGRLILWAHGQAVQVALSSQCAADAAAIVALSPIPRGVDEVIVDAFLDRQKATLDKAKGLSGADKEAMIEQANALKNVAGTKAAEFAAMKGGKFAKDSRVTGATVAFWLGWIALTQKSPALFEAQEKKLIVVVGSGDLQLSKADRELAAKLPAAKVLAVEGDHHLLQGGELDDDVVKALADALDAVMADPQS